ncbi:hypothetical protein PLESTB_001941100 [Pleodorina starrii]|uniref:Sulfhydryl oxidase n=1 Tax=Pleodorina starrii TaxID=330485 RepID=A0A9W6C1Z6_9CHLO|nr:hypothetical protein PLESTM_001925300 [Pleodorina starrii]GLC62801.1 hypothetical protein PLESTB_001941100 [Pleodorina starrii]GLC77482.1 hypothetical protein PLESTF_001940500 [Pleodorina starrii]
MHILDFIFRERYVPVQYGRQPSASPSDADAPSERLPQAVPAASRPCNVPPYVQLFQPRAPVVSGGAKQQTELSRPADGNAPGTSLPSGTVIRQPHDNQQGAGIQGDSKPALSSTAAPGQPGSTPPRSSSSDEASESARSAATVQGGSPPGDPTVAAASAAPLGLKDCRSRACAGVVDSFKRALRPPRGAAAGAGASPSQASAGAGDAEPTAGAGAGAGVAVTDATTSAVAAAAAVAAVAAGTSSSTFASEDAAGGVGGRGAVACPPDSWQLGRATWTFLHSVAAHYPDQPSARQQELMRCMMEGLAEFYPCEVCAEHLREQVRRSPPRVGTARELSLWLCGIHNEVNEMLGKPLFDCSRLAERWRDGPQDGSCD